MGIWEKAEIHKEWYTYNASANKETRLMLHFGLQNKQENQQPPT